ncbi:Alginate lyase [Actinacidiphila yanglinensis]|uniref:Alginate lyase n=1 Tax=Actinacidiphila yanglinensis TaxID=310779 RepID=A0A1H6CLU6_9ACTN|nr:alginate lyase family protein [Actinacidiphila yanglinensis]SEG74009.1 Alginate lyase [Actinacidiphila yanglinensis]
MDVIEEVVVPDLPEAENEAAPTPGADTVAGRATRPGPGAEAVPLTVVLDGGRLRQARELLRAGDPEAAAALEVLTARADRRLTRGPWSVTDKPQTPPSGDRHDYLSQAPYWWPGRPRTAADPEGLPYEQRDGLRNPEVDLITDHRGRRAMFDAVQTLALAWYHTGRPDYAERAAHVLRTWFLDPATRMNPHLAHAQAIPGITDGRPIGIIDFSQQFTSLLDATALLDTGAPGWSAADRDGMHAWYADFTRWLGGTFAAEEAATANNHGTFYDMQLAALQLAIGQPESARRTVLAARTARIDPQIAADGSLPRELARTRSWHYSTFCLVAFTRLALVGRQVGVDLWAYRNPAGAGIPDAVRHLLPAATGRAPWPHPELDFQRFAASDVVRAAAEAGDPAAAEAVPDLQAPPGGDLWPLRPAPEQLDPISGSARAPVTERPPGREHRRP